MNYIYLVGKIIPFTEVLVFIKKISQNYSHFLAYCTEVVHYKTSYLSPRRSKGISQQFFDHCCTCAIGPLFRTFTD